MGEQGKEKKQGEGKEGKENQNANQPNSGAQEGYNPDGSKKPDHDVGVEREVNDKIWDAKKREKEHERASSSEGDSSEPSRYKGMWDEFEKALGKIGSGKKTE